MSLSFEEVLKAATLLLGLVNLLVSLGLWLYVRSSDRHEAIDQRFASLQRDVDERLDGNAQRLARLETQMEKSPTHDDLGRIYERVNAVQAGMSELRGEVSQLSSNIRQLIARVIEKGMP